MRADVRHWLGWIVVAAILSGGADCGDDAPSHASLVTPSFDEPCRYATCSEHGQCVKADDGGPTCLCNVGYTGATCTRCEPGFHTDALGRCAPDRSCDEQDPDPCGIHGGCDDSDGVIMCDCATGFEGPRCTLCQPGYGRDAHDECLMLVLGPDGGSVPPTTSDPDDPTGQPGVSPAVCTEATCNGHGACDGTTGSIVCTCAAGYAGDRCAECGDTYHRDADQKCVPAEMCGAQSCNAHGDCAVSAGVATCTCASGYAGDACADCAPGFHAGDAGSCAADQECISTSCAGHGECTATNSATTCACEDKYSGAHCEACVAGYHHNASGACVVNEVCGPNSCKPNGDCDASSGVIVCGCHAGYGGPACNDCAPAYHRATDTCIADERCQAGSCGAHAMCDESSGTVMCLCRPGYTGDACSACAPGYRRNASTNTCDAFDCEDNPIDGAGEDNFEKVSGMPRYADNCVSGLEVDSDDVQLTSLDGEGTVWACAESTYYAFPNKHVVLVADARGPGELAFAGPIASLSFDYGAKTALALDVLADGKSVKTIAAAVGSHASLALTFDAPITALTLRSTHGASEIAIDNIAYAPPSCP